MRPAAHDPGEHPAGAGLPATASAQRRTSTADVFRRSRSTGPGSVAGIRSGDSATHPGPRCRRRSSRPRHSRDCPSRKGSLRRTRAEARQDRARPCEATFGPAAATTSVRPNRASPDRSSSPRSSQHPRRSSEAIGEAKAARLSRSARRPSRRRRADRAAPRPEPRPGPRAGCSCADTKPRARGPTIREATTSKPAGAKTEPIPQGGRPGARPRGALATGCAG